MSHPQPGSRNAALTTVASLMWEYKQTFRWHTIFMAVKANTEFRQGPVYGAAVCRVYDPPISRYGVLHPHEQLVGWHFIFLELRAVAWNVSRPKLGTGLIYMRHIPVSSRKVFKHSMSNMDWSQNITVSSQKVQHKIICPSLIVFTAACLQGSFEDAPRAFEVVHSKR